MPVVESEPACFAAAAQPTTPQIKAEQIRAVYRRMPLAFAGSALCAALLAVTLAHRLTAALLVVWLVAAFGNSAVCAFTWYRFRQARPSLAELPRWERGLLAQVTLAGLIWGAGGLLLHVPGSLAQQILVLLVMLHMTLSGLLIAGCSVTAFMAFITPVLLLSAVPFLASGDGTCTLVGLATLALLPAACVLAQRLARDQRRALEIQLHHRRLAAHLRVQRRAALDACQAKSRFLAMASHDLRQPLHALDLFVKALQERCLALPERELVANVRRSVDAMEELFDALLHISRLDSGTVRRRVVTFPLEELFDRLRLELGPVAGQKGLELVVLRTPVYVRSDPELLTQILRNLLSNAIRYTEHGRVLMCCRGAQGRVRIEVRDSGCGIPPAEHGRVFQEFTQLDNPVRDRRKGLGLGLAIVDRLARLLSHPVTLRSRVGEGSVFAISLPRGKREEHVPVVPAAGIAGFDLSGITVLLLDDDLAARESLERLLARWSCQVVAAASGAEAIAKLEGRPRPADIILVDHRLREQASEVTVLQRLQGELGPEVPALVVMAGGLSERRDCEAGGVPVLGKPVNPARLRTLLAHIASKVARTGARRAWLETPCSSHGT
jgi:signal transduction histidine kinase/CheY-like chemotaxis protein